MFAEFVYFALAVLLILCESRDGHIGYDISFDTLLRAAVFEYINNMDYMSLSAHQKRAPTTFSQPLVGLGSNYRRRHKSFC